VDLGRTDTRGHFERLAALTRDAGEAHVAWLRLGLGLASGNRGGAATKALARMGHLLGRDHPLVQQGRDCLARMKQRQAGTPPAAATAGPRRAQRG